MLIDVDISERRRTEDLSTLHDNEKNKDGRTFQASICNEAEREDGGGRCEESIDGVGRQRPDAPGI